LQRGRLDFEPPDPDSFPCLKLAMQAAQTGGGAPVVLNASNEVSVAAFLAGRIPFTGIAELVARALDRLTSSPADTLEAVLALDRRTRGTVEAELTSFA
jgi:1-deoxy-D-xylulose-5-phosphate reductoisomerase